jgi:hypothetical protein
LSLASSRELSRFAVTRSGAMVAVPTGFDVFEK